MTPPDALAQDGTYPRPQLVRGAWADLCGTWDFAYDDAAAQAPGAVAFDRTIRVPFPPESEASGVARHGFAPATMWYRRTITAADAAAAGWCAERPRLLVHFGAVDWAATVWVAGHQVAHHVGGHSPFQVDITDVVGTLEAPVDLVARAFDDPLDTAQARGKQDWHETQHSIWYERTSGIWQPVWLEAVPDVHIVELQWTPRIPDNAVDLDLTLSRRPASPAQVFVRLTCDDRELAAGSWTAEGPDWSGRLHLGDLANGQAVQELLWSPESPRLIRAEITLAADGATDAVGSYLGLRTVGTSEDDLLLNGRPYFLRAVLDQGYWPQSHLAAPSPAALRDEVRLIKDLGFNCVRVHQKAEDPRFLYWADREGLLVWAEMAAAYTFNRRAVAAYLQEWVALVRRDRSHPSIAVWVPLNESWGVQHIADRPEQRAYATALASITRALDPERPVISNDGWEHTVSDLWTVHDYTDDPGALVERYGTREAADTVARHGRAEGRVVLLEPVAGSRPVVLSEFGGISFDPSARADSWGYSVATHQDDFANRLGGLLRAAHAARGLAGFCYTQLTDTGLETNGLLGADRTPKLPKDSLRALVLGLDRTAELESPQ